MYILKIAKIAHEVNAAYCRAIGDNSQLSWDDAPQWQKDSAVNGVDFQINNPNTTPGGSHDNWLKEKIADGWTYGEVKNVELKTHPCVVGYEQLPVEQKAKDYIFKQIVESIIAEL